MPIFWTSSTALRSKYTCSFSPTTISNEATIESAFMGADASGLK